MQTARLRALQVGGRAVGGEQDLAGDGRPAGRPSSPHAPAAESFGEHLHEARSAVGERPDQQSSPWVTVRQPAATAAATSGAGRVPANLSGQSSTRMPTVWQPTRAELRASRAVGPWLRDFDLGGTLQHGDGSAAARPGQRPGHRARRGVPGRPARAQRSGSGGPRHGGQGALGDEVFVLGHHYQRDEVIQFADVTGDSFKLAREAAARPDAEYIVFCGVHFMAETADILTAAAQQVILPDLAAGCSMADMAAIARSRTPGTR